MNFDSNKITIVVPALNEAANIGSLLISCQQFSGQLIVADGHSNDETPKIARESGAEVIQDNGKGKGDAIRCAIPHILNEITVFIDADGSHNPQDIPRLVEPLLTDEADHVSGCRLRHPETWNCQTC